MTALEAVALIFVCLTMVALVTGVSLVARAPRGRH